MTDFSNLEENFESFKVNFYVIYVFMYISKLFRCLKKFFTINIIVIVNSDLNKLIHFEYIYKIISNIILKLSN